MKEAAIMKEVTRRKHSQVPRNENLNPRKMDNNKKNKQPLL